MKKRIPEKFFSKKFLGLPPKQRNSIESKLRGGAQHLDQESENFIKALDAINYKLYLYRKPPTVPEIEKTLSVSDIKKLNEAYPKFLEKKARIAAQLDKLSNLATKYLQIYDYMTSNISIHLEEFNPVIVAMHKTWKRLDFIMTRLELLQDNLRLIKSVK